VFNDVARVDERTGEPGKAARRHSRVAARSLRLCGPFSRSDFTIARAWPVSGMGCSEMLISRPVYSICQ
jgi:hypothetical protein